MAERFKVGDMVKPTKLNPWLEQPAKYLSLDKTYEVIGVYEDRDRICLIKDSGIRDGFPVKGKGGSFFTYAVTPKISTEFEEEEILRALEFIES